MEVVVADDYAALSRRAAEAVVDACAASSRASSLVVPAVGRTTSGLYRELLARHREPLASLEVAQLDEYIGLAETDGRLLASWLRRELLDALGIPPERFLRFASRAASPRREAGRMEGEIVARGGIGLAVLGLGPNGHIGFNEPGSPFDAPTRPVLLTAESVASNAAYWGGPEAVPRRAQTLGMALLGAAERAILLVSGVRKRAILRRTLFGPIGPDLPATLLRTMPRVTVIADRDAMAEDPDAPAP